MADQPIPILLYHSLTVDASEPYRRFAMDPGQFAEQMEHIAAGGYQTLTVSQLVAATTSPDARLPERPLLITFDDGFEEIHSVALPVLSRLGLRSTTYVVTGQIGGRSTWLADVGEDDRPILSSGQIRELDVAGVEIGPHGHRHVPLDQIPFAKAASDIDRSRQALEEVLGHSVATFAYPYSYFSEVLKRHLRESGFSSACGVKQAFSYVGDDPFGLARVIVGSDVSMRCFDEWLRGEGLPVAWPGERSRTRMWRALRRARVAIAAGRSCPDD